MKRHPAIISLSHDHHHGLLLAQLIKKGAPEYKGLPKDLKGKIEYTKNAWENELKKHFENEEDILFPVSKGKDDEADKMINEITAEHEQIKKFIFSLDDAPNPADTLDQLGKVLENHIRKEERILFPRIQEILSVDELKTLGEKLNEGKQSSSSG